MLEANFLTILLIPNYETAVDTAQDILDRGLAVLHPPGTESLVELLKNAPDYTTRTLAERTIVCKSWAECDGWDEYKGKGLIPEAVQTGTYVYEVGFLYPEDLVHGKWHRSKDRKGGRNPFASYMMSKKWTLEEEFNNHMLRFQQVRGVYLFQ